MDEEEIPELTWICPDCDYIRQHGMFIYRDIAMNGLIQQVVRIYPK